MGTGSGEDGSMLIAEQAGPTGDDGDTVREVEEMGDAVVCNDHAETSLQGGVGPWSPFVALEYRGGKLNYGLPLGGGWRDWAIFGHDILNRSNNESNLLLRMMV